MTTPEDVTLLITKLERMIKKYEHDVETELFYDKRCKYYIYHIEGLVGAYKEGSIAKEEDLCFSCGDLVVNNNDFCEGCKQEQEQKDI